MTLLTTLTVSRRRLHPWRAGQIDCGLVIESLERRICADQDPGARGAAARSDRLELAPDEAGGG